MYIKPTRSLGALEQSFNGPIHVAVPRGGSHPLVAQALNLNTKTIENGFGGSNVVSMLIAKPATGSALGLATLSSPEGDFELQTRLLVFPFPRDRVLDSPDFQIFVSVIRPETGP